MTTDPAPVRNPTLADRARPRPTPPTAVTPRDTQGRRTTTDHAGVRFLTHGDTARPRPTPPAALTRRHAQEAAR
ncbi:hypothetical protein GCM10011579_014380 [Streptomyces albiflavescens]|uniref:Uncharacterized protein n=1 Tax=Streptomyces albiflavescens TaxID=1623582 RepID=A0A917XUY4_9ACTN|nr:hypothetical protein GCM10011579_014380 [Streptomyces albiflavescens]